MNIHSFRRATSIRARFNGFLNYPVLLLQLLALFVITSYVDAQTVTIQKVTTSFGGKDVTPSAQLGHTVGSGSVIVDYSLANLTVTAPAIRVAYSVTLLENGVRVKGPVALNFPDDQYVSISYIPASPGLKTLTVSVNYLGGAVTPDSVQVQMFGTLANTSLGDTIGTAILPFTSRIFLGADAAVQGGNIKKTEFFHRSKPFQVTDGVVYRKGDLTLQDGILYQALVDYSGIAPLGSPVPVLSTLTVDPNPSFKAVGPNFLTGYDYHVGDLAVAGGNIYKFSNSGRPSAVPAGPAGTTAADVVFQQVNVNRLINAPYFVGDIVISNGRAYEVVQGGLRATTLNLQSTDGQPEKNGNVLFAWVPTKTLKSGLQYYREDLVISNSNVFQAQSDGMITLAGLGSGLPASISEVRKSGLVSIVAIGTTYSVGVNYVEDDYVIGQNGLIYQVVVGGTSADASGPESKTPNQTEALDDDLVYQFVVPQYHKYTRIDKDYAGTPLTQGKQYFEGDVVNSNGKIYEVITSGILGPVGSGLSDVSGSDFSASGLTFTYISVAGKQPLIGLSPYASFDNAAPYRVKWSPSDTITNDYSSFGRAGYFETNTEIEYFSRVTDSKDLSYTSVAIPISILPPIASRALLNTNIIAPTNNRTVAAGTAVQVTAESRDISGVVRLVDSVQFFVDGVAIEKKDNDFPYSTSDANPFKPTVAGSYNMTAIAQDDKGNFTMSNDVVVNVTDNLPFIKITSPVSDNPRIPTFLASGSPVTITFLASGSGGNLPFVTLYADGNLITNPWTPYAVSGGQTNYQLVAKATDANGATAFSQPVYVSVVPVGGSVPNNPNNTTFVSATATDASASDRGGNTGTVTFTRTGTTLTALLVNYNVSGSAKPGVNYAKLSGSVTIPVGSTTATVIIRALRAKGSVVNAILTPTLTVNYKVSGTPATVVIRHFNKIGF